MKIYKWPKPVNFQQVQIIDSIIFSFLKNHMTDCQLTKSNHAYVRFIALPLSKTYFVQWNSSYETENLHYNQGHAGSFISQVKYHQMYRISLSIAEDVWVFVQTILRSLLSFASCRDDFALIFSCVISYNFRSSVWRLTFLDISWLFMLLDYFTYANIRVVIRVRKFSIIATVAVTREYLSQDERCMNACCNLFVLVFCFYWRCTSFRSVSCLLFIIVCVCGYLMCVCFRFVLDACVVSLHIWHRVSFHFRKEKNEYQ